MFKGVSEFNDELAREGQRALMVHTGSGDNIRGDKVVTRPARSHFTRADLDLLTVIIARAAYDCRDPTEKEKIIRLYEKTHEMADKLSN